MSELDFNADVFDGAEYEAKGKGSGPLPSGDYVMKIQKVELRVSKPMPNTTATRGWTQYNTTFVVASGEHEGKIVYGNYNWDAPRDESGNIVGNPDKVAALVADGLSLEEASEKVVANAKQAVSIGQGAFLELANAAGFIRQKDCKPGDSNMRRIDSGLAVGMSKTPAGYEIVSDGRPTGSIFNPSMLEGRLVMVRTKSSTKSNGKTYQEPKRVWDVDPKRVGDLASQLAF